jgi:hypothetical protein
MSNLHAIGDSEQQPEPADPFDPDTLRLGSLVDVDVERVLTSVPVRKPNPNEFFRVHPDFVTDTFILERQDGLDREAYLVTPAVQDLVTLQLRRVRLFTVITKRGTLLLWPARLPRVDSSDGGRRWAETALVIAEQAKTLWVKMFGNRDLGGYERFRAKGDLGEPQWPDKKHRDLIALGFRDRLIDRPDHPVIREIHGEL